MTALGKSGRRVPDEIVARMHVDYCRPMALAAVARIHGVSPKGVRDMFKCRGLSVRDDPKGRSKRLPDGRIAPVSKLTAEEIESVICGCVKLRVPLVLKQEWRGWTLERRGEFVRRLRAKLAAPRDMPKTPLPDGMIAFDYGTPEAHEICRRANVGLSSRKARLKVDLCSQGVIWRGVLWFWSYKVGYQRGPWTPDSGRPALHTVVWEEANGRSVPPHHVLRFLDGDRNNIVPENLSLQYRGELGIENRDLGRSKRRTTTRFFQVTAAAAALATT